jgi:hypothetical protein
VAIYSFATEFATGESSSGTCIFGVMAGGIVLYESDDRKSAKRFLFDSSRACNDT